MSITTHVHPREGDTLSVNGSADTFAVTVTRGDYFGAASVSIFLTPEQAATVVEKFSAGLRERAILAEVRAKVAAEAS